MDPIDIVVVSFVLAYDGTPISSTRIRSGEINQKVSEIHGEIKRLDTKINHVESTLNAKIDKVEDTLSLAIMGTHDRIDALEKRFDDMKEYQNKWFSLFGILFTAAAILAPVAVAIVQKVIK